MSPARHPRRARLTSAMAVLTLSGGACTTWRVEPRSLPAPLDVREPGVILVRLRSTEELLVYEPRLSGDSLIGFSAPATADSRSRVAIHQRDVVEVSYQAIDGWKTVRNSVLVFGGVLAALTLIAVAACANAY